MDHWRGIIYVLIFILTFCGWLLILSIGQAKQIQGMACLSDSSKRYLDLKMEATAYTAGPESTGKSPGHPAYGITKSGTTVKEGRTIAVDPDVIPLGTPVEVWYKGEKMGEYVAEDTGRLIKGCIIDLYYDELQDALNWGRRQVTVRVPREAITYEVPP